MSITLKLDREEAGLAKFNDAHPLHPLVDGLTLYPNSTEGDRLVWKDLQYNSVMELNFPPTVAVATYNGYSDKMEVSGYPWYLILTELQLTEEVPAYWPNRTYTEEADPETEIPHVWATWLEANNYTLTSNAGQHLVGDFGKYGLALASQATAGGFTPISQAQAKAFIDAIPAPE